MQTTYEKECQICGAVFTTTTMNKKVCCEDCSEELKRAREKKYNANKDYSHKGQKYEVNVSKRTGKGYEWLDKMNAYLRENGGAYKR